MDMDRMIAMHSQELDTLHNLKIDESTSSSASQGTVTAPKSNGTISDTPNLKVKNFGSWEPKEFESSFGTGKIVGPVGYYISWNSRAAEEGEKEKKEGEGAGTSGGAGSTSSEGMETSAQ